MHKKKDLDAVLIIQNYMPKTFEVKHVRGYQDRRKKRIYSH